MVLINGYRILRITFYKMLRHPIYARDRLLPGMGDSTPVILATWEAEISRSAV
jgi:hypothetical protein